jgi:hypothetical protein
MTGLEGMINLFRYTPFRKYRPFVYEVKPAFIQKSKI